MNANSSSARPTFGGGAVVSEVEVECLYRRKEDSVQLLEFLNMDYVYLKDTKSEVVRTHQTSSELA